MNANEHHDLAFADAMQLGWFASTELPPDEALMLAEGEDSGIPADASEAEWMASLPAKAACLWSIIMAVTWRAADVTMIRDRVAVIAAEWCREMLPAKSLWYGREGQARARQVWAECPEYSWEYDAGRSLIALLIQDGWKPYHVGLNALCFLYFYQSDRALRPAIAQSLEAIGQALGLKATNVRSAICAALQRGPLEMEKQMRRAQSSRIDVEAWYMKHAHCREALSVALQGNENRAGDAEEEDAVEVREGVQVKPEYAGMSKRQLREMFDRLEWEQAERKG